MARVNTPQVYRTTSDTKSVNDMLKLAGQGLQSLAAENTKLHRDLYKSSSEKAALQCELDLYKVAHDLARMGHFKESHIPTKVSQWMSEKRDPAFIRQLYTIGGDRSSVDSAKTSSAPLDGSARSVPSSSSQTSSSKPVSNNWVTFVEELNQLGTK